MLRGLPAASQFVRKTEEHLKAMVAPGIIFEELGFNYIGPIDGHDLRLLVQTLENLKDLEEPVFLHVVTRKGKGYAPAEEDPVGYHAFTKLEPTSQSSPPQRPQPPKYQDVFGRWLVDAASRDPRLVAITPAMCEGSGMRPFAERFPERFFDVGIAEQHAVTLAAGLACEGKKPVVAIYSTFLQRAYDQLIHDVALQNLDVLLAIDRAGLVGEDGPTHAGAFDLSYLRCIPNLVVMAPSDENETRRLLQTGYLYPGPAAVRYPRGRGPGTPVDSALEPLPLGKGRLVRAGGAGRPRIAILNFGALLPAALGAAQILDATVADMRFVKPLDCDLVDELAADHDLLVTLEENAVLGGAGSAVAEHLNAAGRPLPLLQLGLPDRFVPHASQGRQRQLCGLDPEGIVQSIRRFAARLDPPACVPPHQRAQGEGP
ncbi:MAG: hypothetical protein KatS3mg124_2043 [Porticoccaceae bacterium]|nr:MAG: hypothetical protein KatS3mg124_2043 [Porticoccaceae bacterium]